MYSTWICFLCLSGFLTFLITSSGSSSKYPSGGSITRRGKGERRELVHLAVMERSRASVVMVSASILLLLLLVCLLHPLLLDDGSALGDEGAALSRFREGLETDPYGSLDDWGTGQGRSDPCSWNGVGCEHGRVVSLVLENRLLKGTLSPELGKLVHLKYLILHNNSFHGSIPREIGGLIRLEILDLGYNNLTGPLPSDLDNLPFLEILVVKENMFLDAVPSGLPILDGFGINADHLSFGKRYISRFGGNATLRRFLQQQIAASAPASSSAPAAAPSSYPSPPPQLDAPTKKGTQRGVYVAIGVVLSAIVIGVVCYIVIRGKNVVPVGPWQSGLSGQLRGALKTGARSLKRAEVETACEDFSNIIGFLSDGKLYKGTLSNGTEIAVSLVQPEQWWDSSQFNEAQFSKKIRILSRVNHKNFINLLGYCKEEKPMTRMMVFEYAPNGTLFEHLHVRESQGLSWAARLRIAMGVAYCLEYMHHQLSPPIVLGNLNSSTIHMTDDFSAKVADLELRSGTTECLTDPAESWGQIAGMSSIVHKFGVLLLEIISGRPTYTDEDGGLVNWANDYLKGLKSIKHIVDPSLDSFNELDAINVVNIAKDCLNPDPHQRLSMKQVVKRLRDVTSITPEAAAPRLSPLWWAELEILSSEE